MSRRPRSVQEITQNQRGLITRAQALRSGWSDDAIRNHVRRGSWTRVRPGLYAVAGVPLEWEHTVLGAILVVPAPAWASHATAARLWGYDARPEDPVELTTVLEQRVRLRGVRSHRSGTLVDADLRTVDGIPVLSAARTIVDLSSRLTERALGTMIDDGLRRRVLSIPALHAVAARLDTIAPGRSPKTIRVLLGDRTVGYHPGDSELEARVRNAIRAAGLPDPVPQHRVRAGGRTYFIDLAYPPPTMIAIEADGFDFHRGRGTFDSDRRRQNDLVNAGWIVLRFTTTSTDDEIARVVRAALFGRSSAS